MRKIEREGVDDDDFALTGAFAIKNTFLGNSGQRDSGRGEKDGFKFYDGFSEIRIHAYPRTLIHLDSNTKP